KENYSLVVAKNDKYFAVVSKDEDMTSNYDFKYIFGQDSSTKDYLYIYPDRPLYRPGDTVYFKGLLRNFKYNGFYKSEAKIGRLNVVDEEGKIIMGYDVKIDKNSNFNGKFDIPKNINLGRYNFQFYIGKDVSGEPVYNDGYFFVEEYKKPTFKVNASDPGKDAMLGDKVDIKVNPEYYFGGKVINTKYDFSVTSQNYFFDAKDYSSYQFGEGYEYFDCVYWGYCDYSDNLLTTRTGKIEANGEAEEEYTYPSEEKDQTNDTKNGEKIYNFNFTVADPDTGKTVNKTVSQVLHNTDGYVGLNVPYFSQFKNGVDINGIVIDYDTKPLGGKEIKIEIIKKEWKNVKKQGVDGVFYNEYTNVDSKEDEFKINSSANGEFKKHIQTKTDGEYEIKAIYSGGNKKSYSSSSVIYISGDSYIEWNNGNNTVTDLTIDKRILKVGEVADFSLKSPVKSGKMFVTIEKDDGILDFFIKDIASYGEKIQIPIKDNYYPNVYVKIFVIGKEGNNPLPVYKRALGVVKVVTDYKKLNVAITTDKKNYLPGEKVNLTVKVTDLKGNPAPWVNGSLSIVDESLLALKGNPKKNPFAFFYDMKRYLGVETFLSLVNLIEKLEVKDLSNGEKGGAGEGQKGGLAKKKRGDFKDTAFWSADYETDKNGEFKITTSVLPDNLTTWVVESVVSTSADNKVGVGETTFMTNKTVMISENLPRFLSSSDRITLSPIIFNKTGKDSGFTVSLNITGTKKASDVKKIFIKNGEQAQADFPIEINNLGITDDGKIASKINIKAESEMTNETDEIEINLPVYESSTPEFVSIVGKTNGVSDTQKISIQDIVNYAGTLKINYAPTLFSSILDSIDYLNNFPYGCSEQKTSAIMPNIYIKKLYDSAKMPFDLKTKMIKYWISPEKGYGEKSVDDVIKEYLVEMIKFQKNDGGFDYWSDNTFKPYSDFRLTSYILESVSQIRDLGYNLDKNTFDNATAYLKNRFYIGKYEGCISNQYFSCNYEENQKIDAISAILSYNKNDYEAYKMWKLIKSEEKDVSSQVKKLDVISKLLKVSSLTESDKKYLNESAKNITDYIMNNEIVYNPKGAFVGKDFAQERLENTVGFLSAVSSLGTLKETDQILDNMARWIMTQKKNGSFGSTWDNSKVIKGLANYITNSKEFDKINMNAKFYINSNLVEDKNIDSKNKFDINSKTLKFSDLKGENDFVVNKTGEGNIYYDLNLKYYLPAEKIQARDEGFFVEQAYYDYNEYKNIEALKNAEFQKYLNLEIEYNDLKYPKDIIEYIKSISEAKVGQLVIAYGRIITGEARDQVAFESFIPSGSELVNPNLDTENKDARFNNLFEREEFRDDRYFGYNSNLGAGVYDVKYILRITHSGEFNIKPTRVYEFYNEEVFGRTGGRKFGVK
ncbi:MAG: MG2 domain-containing protein, partial [Candidatus Gracilibacteria bacterium]|nr:MG2 domain-containing protein [Candidatus Gracilibacteria bacterium]